MKHDGNLMKTNRNGYQHTQRSPLCALLYFLAFTFLVMSIVLRTTPGMFWIFLLAGLPMLVLAAAFHHLKVEDRGTNLFVSFGPLPLFRRSVDYDRIVSVEAGRTTILDGWGIHLSLKGGWVWNIWGRDCVVVRLNNGRVLRIGTDDTANLVHFLAQRCGRKQ